MNTKQIGDSGEAFAEAILAKKGYEIIEKNFRYKRSEIDLICLKNDLLVFVEVKTLSHQKFQYPEEQVNEHKIKMILQGADAYIHAINWAKDIRFDIFSIDLSSPDKYLHIEDAFY